MTPAARVRARKRRDSAWRALRYLWSLPGAGVVTGASDDDPSGIATYSITGAQTGYSLLWTNVMLVPLGAAVQEMCARIGLVTGGGLAAVLRRHYSRRLLISLVILLLIANTVNIGADIAAVASGVSLLTGVPDRYLMIPAGLSIALSQILVPYRIFATYLKLLTLVLFAYVLDAFFAGPDWTKALRLTVVPHIKLQAAFITTLVANLGTTITPYLFFWQASQQVEEMHRHSIASGDAAELRRARLDTDVGMLLANVIAWFIVLTTATTLFPAGITEINTARDAAEALRPLAGGHAATLFAFGLVGLGLLAIPVLAGSGAYAIAEVFDWREGLESRPTEAPQFYAVIALGTLIGLLLALTGVGAIRALFVAAVLNGVVAPVLIGAIIVVSNDRDVLGVYRNGWVSNTLGIASVAVMGVSAIGMAVAFLTA